MKQDIKVLLETAIEFVDSVHSGEWGSSTDRDELVIAMQEAIAQLAPEQAESMVIEIGEMK
jgi:hypothetical protein